MMENISYLLMSITCFVFAYAHFKGNVSLVHSYHKRKIEQENLMSYSKTMGVGMLICGLGCLMNLLARLLRLFVLGEIFMVIGIIAGVGIMLYAQLKYNHGIF